MTSPRYPTSQECHEHWRVDGGTATWVPQIGGYASRAVAVVEDMVGEGCVDLYIWHDGEYPTDDEVQMRAGRPVGGEPNVVHICCPQDFVSFAEFLQGLSDRGEMER